MQDDAVAIRGTLDSMNRRFDAMDRRFESMEDRLEGLEHHATVTNSKLDVIHARLESTEKLEAKDPTRP